MDIRRLFESQALILHEPGKRVNVCRPSEWHEHVSRSLITAMLIKLAQTLALPFSGVMLYKDIGTKSILKFFGRFFLALSSSFEGLDS